MKTRLGLPLLNLALSALLLLSPYFSATTAEAAGGTTLSPKESLKELQAGNQRFVLGKTEAPRRDAERRVETALNGQKPIALVLACSDSRVPVELLFDQGIGDIFVARVAGNTAGPAVLGSIEYALDHLKAPLVVVLGHTKCGAVESVWNDAQVDGNLAGLLAPIEPAVRRVKEEHPGWRSAEERFKRLAETYNVRNVMAAVSAEAAGAARLVKKGKLRIVGAVYDLESGQIIWLEKK